jgi:hypothetical protein
MVCLVDRKEDGPLDLAQEAFLDGKDKMVASWAALADERGAWIWVPCNSPLSATTLGFLALREKVRHWGKGARRVINNLSHLVDG